MASIILPTFEWTRSCAQLARQLEPEDELLVVCDHEDDPVASAELPENAELLVAGEPEGCSGKANAVALALEHASQDRIVLTDDDVDRTNWVTWGGGVTFDRREIDLEGYVGDLRRTVSDDALLAEYTDEVVASREIVNKVYVPGGPRVTYERITRFATIFYRFAPRRTLAILGLFLAVAAAGILAPLLVAFGVTYIARDRYRSLGVDRRTWVFAVPSLLLAPFFVLAGIVRPTFVWGGRRYHWPDTFDVTVVD
ncbi:putative glycosyltransferase, family 21 (plasmid) [Natrialba magadii ATCC 43099]|uniref:Glycosyl transferase family protein n=1 Tax=Natrialba magadii (strain ATCC 43099 / DSM 3394 / CCM 3739 / CIP 104546 / IAM 13178 / JCM 8861 / NBRC 102185 / NCIMB 2190 / MS3) TaxID=547559 RepID=D3T258_NATMM|nr:glycosyltransferase family A protein [Natrialba magadii]ADD07667.1 putative glycosyltransferase, family 21 [Natrialba magadii ATCC 43099]ELY27146.1 glycosyl transferase family protein [Natrialba magadii ATCC 43099]